LKRVQNQRHHGDAGSDRLIRVIVVKGRRWLQFAGLVGIAVGVILVWSLRATPEVQVTTAPITVGSVARRIVTTGTIQAVTAVEVGSQVSGTIQALGADYNSTVRAGQVLARIDPATYEADLREAQAALALSQADADRARTTVMDAGTKLARAEVLAQRQLIPRADLDSAEAAKQSADAGLLASEAQVEQAKRATEQANTDLDHTVIRSPIDGIVMARNIEIGQTVAATLQSPRLFLVATDFKRVQLQVQLDEADVGGVQTGALVTFDVEAHPQEMFNGLVSEIRLGPFENADTQLPTQSPTQSTSQSTTQSTAPAVTTYLAIVDVPNPDEKLRPGMTATVTLAGSHREDVTRIPNSALSFRPPPDVLHAIGEDNVPSPNQETQPSAEPGNVVHVWQYDGQFFTPITLHVGLSDDRMTEVLNGPLKVGDQLVTGATIKRHFHI
jgi:HlyD family secretion protein